MFLFILIIASMVLISAQTEKNFTVTQSEVAINANSNNQNSVGKLSAENLNQIEVNFISNPIDSDLYIDNVNQGKTPKTVFLDPGTHVVRISKFGFFTANFNIFLRSGFKYTYTVRMFPGTGNPIPFFTDLRIVSSFPQGLNMSFITDVSGGSGEYRFFWNFGDGSTQTTDTNVVFHTYPAVGRYTAIVNVRDLDTGLSSTSFRSFTLKNNSFNNINGTLKISSSPTNATITINGVNYGHTPNTISLKPGSYVGVLSLPGYVSRVFIFEIRKGSINNLKINLKPLRTGLLNSGIVGVIMYGPVSPVCFENSTCDKAYHGNVIVKSLDKTSTKTFFTNSDGMFKVSLKPGNYNLIVNRKFIRPCEQNITVVQDTYTHINLTCDTGIR